MQKELQLRLPPRTAATPSALRQHVARLLGADPATVEVRVLRRSIDARQRQIHVNLTVRAYLDEPLPDLAYAPVRYPSVEGREQVVVVGAGPGGLFAALRLIELGLRPVVLERGKDVHARRKDIALISRRHTVDGESNYAFGEGGAGAYSDGKLYTRSTKRGSVEKILTVFCQHGASPDILADAHPHIGTDRLPGVIEAMRETIRRQGGEVRFQTRADELLMDARQRVCGVRCQTGEEFLGPVILATGHSARDVYRMLHRQQVRLEAKGLAIGVRLEHRSHLIDQIMYHSANGRGDFLPAAEYRMTAQCGGRGVYSFCMCPGGFVIPAASADGQLVVNGMSPSGRNGAWSNSGMVVETRPEDLADDSLRALLHEEPVADSDPLRMMYLQEALEARCWQQAGRTQAAPAQRMEDFVRRRPSRDLPASSYSPGLTGSTLSEWMPRFLDERLREGFQLFGRRYRGFLTNDALMLAIETRTSSPVRIVRQVESLQHIDVPGLYPCGEGAGYAGGIVSAAIDGERCAEAVARQLNVA